jgi:hypothetical protein
MKTKILLSVALAVVCLAFAGCEEPEVVEKEYTIKMIPAEGGYGLASVLGYPVGKAAEGKEIALQAMPATGYKFVAWEIVGATTQTPNDDFATFIMPANNVSVTTRFEKK